MDDLKQQYKKVEGCGCDGSGGQKKEGNKKLCEGK
jgi:hypothetical protein